MWSWAVSYRVYALTSKEETQGGNFLGDYLIHWNVTMVRNKYPSLLEQLSSLHLLLPTCFLSCLWAFLFWWQRHIIQGASSGHKHAWGISLEWFPVPITMFRTY